MITTEKKFVCKHCGYIEILNFHKILDNCPACGSKDYSESTFKKKWVMLREKNIS